MVRLLLCILFFSLISCSHVEPIEQVQEIKKVQVLRLPASTIKSNCTNLASDFFKLSLDNKIPQSQREAMLVKSERFWSDVYKHVDQGSTTWWSRQKRRVLRMMQNLNENDFPVYFIRDSEETMPKILKAEEYFLNKRTMTPNDLAGSNILDVIDGWMGRYSNLVEDLNQLLSRYLSLQDSITQLNRLKNTELAFPTTHEFRFINSENEYVVEVKEFLNKEKLIRFRDTLRSKAKEIQRGWIFKNGTIKQRMLQQAEDQQRLLTLYDRLNDVMLTNEARGIKNSQELLERVDRLKELLFKRSDLHPSKKIDSLLAHRELSDELKYLFETIKNKPLVVEGKKFLASLNENQRKVLKLDSRGRAGEIVSYVKGNKTLSFLYAATGLSGTAYSLSWVAIQAKDLLLSKAEKRMECARAENSDEQFFSCFQKYLEKQFKLEHPFVYVKDGYQGLFAALDADQERFDEFKYEFEMFVRVRAKELEAKHLEDEFKKQFLEKLDFRFSDESADDKADEMEWEQREEEDQIPKYQLILRKVKIPFM